MLVGMTSDRQVQAEVADLAAHIERLSGTLTLAEEPSSFAVALEEGAGDE